MLSSHYLVAIRKCENRGCCKRFRSSLKKHLPIDLLPASREHTHITSGDLALVRLDKVDISVKFASLSNIMAQPKILDLPFDTYNKKVYERSQVFFSGHNTL